MRARRPRLTLDPEAYRKLCRTVLERDGWRCQSCGQIEGLQVHHIQPRSRLGDDTPENPIALCAAVWLSVGNVPDSDPQMPFREIGPGTGESHCTGNPRAHAEFGG